MSFGYVRRDVLILDKGNLRSARHDALICHPGTCRLPANCREGQRRTDVTRGQGAGRLTGGHLARRVLVPQQCRKYDRNVTKIRKKTYMR